MVLCGRNIMFLTTIDSHVSDPVGSRANPQDLGACPCVRKTYLINSSPVLPYKGLVGVQTDVVPHRVCH